VHEERWIPGLRTLLRIPRTSRPCRATRWSPCGGDRKGQYSIRINDQWRICFEWPKGGNGPVNVEITDYH